MSEKIYGRKPVLEAIKSGQRVITRLYLIQGAKDDIVHLIEAQAKSKGIPVTVESRRRLDSLAATDKHQGVLAVIESFRYADPRDILDAAEKKKEPLFAVVLDELEDPHNLGAILRSCDAAGVHGVIIPKDRAAEVTPAVVKVSAGAAEHVLTAKVSNVNDAIRKLKESGAWVVGADAEGTQDFHRYDFNRPTVLVIGNEGKGLRRLVKENCDSLVKIPMYGKVSSLNASVSAALLLYEVVRQRKWLGSAPPPGPSTPSYPPPSFSSYAPPASPPMSFFQDTPASPPPGDTGFFVQALIRTLKRRIRALLRR